MSNLREIQSRIHSVRDTMKITNAMYMIASSKLQKAKKSLKNTEPYFYTLQDVIAKVIKQVPEDNESIYFHSKPKASNEKKKGYLIITGDKGLAGAYNHNVIKIAESELKKEGKPVFFLIGQVGRRHFEKKRIPYDEEFHYTVQNPTIHRARVISGRILQMYNENKLDEVYVIYTRMIHSMECKAEMKKLLPLDKADFQEQEENSGETNQTNYLPTPYAVLNHVIPNYITGFLYGTLVQAYASEQNSRMLAMESATRNAKEMLRGMSVTYNRVRQAAITQEITEVISGAKLLKRRKL
ncbi:MAG: ATP synthase F1 subunit gamma [Clostridiales bacterium]|jgi:F-type H+-transporting ATPase subunit gamma|nr:ATP synthase F1 subunit gamma [Clostridiales bacterium]